MCLFFESIKIKDGHAWNPDLHEERMNRTRREVLGLKDRLSLREVLHSQPTELTKCRVIYGENNEKIEFIPYIARRIERLKIVSCDEIQYGYKYADRSCFEPLLTGLPPDADILIVKNGLVTDTSFANIIFWDGSRWVTPSAPLLPGIKRELLLHKGVIHEQEIRLNDLPRFQSAKLINAMLDPEDTGHIYIRNIS